MYAFPMYAFSLWTEYVDEIYRINTSSLYMDWIYGFNICIPCQHSLYAFSTWIEYMDSICLEALDCIFQL